MPAGLVDSNARAGVLQNHGIRAAQPFAIVHESMGPKCGVLCKPGKECSPPVLPAPYINAGASRNQLQPAGFKLRARALPAGIQQCLAEVRYRFYLLVSANTNLPAERFPIIMRQQQARPHFGGFVRQSEALSAGSVPDPFGTEDLVFL